MERAVADFLRHLEHERRCSRHTLRAYATDLRQLLDHLRAGGRVPPPEAVGHREIRAFLAALAARGVGPRSRGRKVAAVRS
ncbi:MAG: tyrosine recombinase XerC, partial [Nitrospirae bacterium]